MVHASCFNLAHYSSAQNSTGTIFDSCSAGKMMVMNITLFSRRRWHRPRPSIYQAERCANSLWHDARLQCNFFDVFSNKQLP